MNNYYNEFFEFQFVKSVQQVSVLVYSALRSVRAVDRIVELCTRDLAYIWLAQGEWPQRDAFYAFINNKLMNEILKDSMQASFLAFLHVYCFSEVN